MCESCAPQWPLYSLSLCMHAQDFGVCTCMFANANISCFEGVGVWMFSCFDWDLIRLIITRLRLKPRDVSNVTPSHTHPKHTPHPTLYSSLCLSPSPTTNITSVGSHGNVLLPPVDGALIRAAIMGWLQQGRVGWSEVGGLVRGTGGRRVGSGLVGHTAEIFWALGIKALIENLRYSFLVPKWSNPNSSVWFPGKLMV